jgi:predicted RNA-binding protein (virulence factor B family)
MLELGKFQKLTVVRNAQSGVYLISKKDKDKEDVLLPNRQVPPDIRIGDELNVFIYRDSEDRMVATLRKPKITIGEIASLKVSELTPIGAYLDWGLEKDLFLPFKEQRGDLQKGSKYLVALYVDKSSRLCATMNIHKLLSTESPYKENDNVSGIVYSISRDIGAFIAVDNRFFGLIPKKELFIDVKYGESLNVRVKSVKPDGKLELSLRKNAAYTEIDADAVKILEKLKARGGKLMLNDYSPPEKVKAELNMSKAAFKRAAGRLTKQRKIKMTDKGIETVVM